MAFSWIPTAIKTAGTLIGANMANKSAKKNSMSIGEETRRRAAAAQKYGKEYGFHPSTLLGATGSGYQTVSNAAPAAAQAIGDNLADFAQGMTKKPNIQLAEQETQSRISANNAQAAAYMAAAEQTRAGLPAGATGGAGDFGNPQAATPEKYSGQTIGPALTTAGNAEKQNPPYTRVCADGVCVDIPGDGDIDNAIVIGGAALTVKTAAAIKKRYAELKANGIGKNSGYTSKRW